MDARHDAALAAATTALAIERVALAHDGRATTGALDLTPGIVSAVAGEADLAVDLRHADASSLAGMLAKSMEAGEAAAAERGCELAVEPIWEIEPIAFDPELIAAARAACEEVTGSDRVLTSGALHDAAEVARVVPTAMVFTPSIAGLSHTPDEDTADEDLATGIEAFGLLANRVLSDLAR
jgi:N-carbamoyl-L-amino-acid hydrolase